MDRGRSSPGRPPASEERSPNTSPGPDFTWCSRPDPPTGWGRWAPTWPPGTASTTEWSPSTSAAPRAATDLVTATADIDVGLLISNAGNGRPGRFLDQNLDDLHRRLTLNATTHLDLAHAFGHRFVARGRGGIVLVSALGAIHGLPNMAHESAAKAYVLNLGEALHYELGPDGVDVMVLLPGNVDTPIIEAYGVDRAAMPIRPIPALAAVHESLVAFTRGRPRHIPGRRMRVLTRLMPRTQSIRLNGRMLGQAALRLAEREAKPRIGGRA